jgi:hypothetical protein
MLRLQKVLGSTLGFKDKRLAIENEHSEFSRYLASLQFVFHFQIVKIANKLYVEHNIT